ncbi:MAG: acylphosphatase [Planctomycetes bacterium]|nr:acylphosphatase [Planctomycetota bacterium]
MAQQKRTVIFSGTVQGVGFRYTACRTAALYKVAGYVRNLSDGGVECVIEGDSGEIQAFLNELNQKFRDYIRDVKEQISPSTDQYKSFDVQF